MRPTLRNRGAATSRSPTAPPSPPEPPNLAKSILRTQAGPCQSPRSKSYRERCSVFKAKSLSYSALLALSFFSVERRCSTCFGDLDGVVAMFRSDGADAPPPSLSTFPFPSSPQPSFSTFVSQCSSPSLYVDRLVSSFPHLSRPPAPPPPLPSYDLWSPSYPAFSSRSAPPADAARRHGSYASLAPPPWGSAESRSNPALDFGPERPEWPRTPRFGRLDRTPSWLVDHSLASRPSSSYGDQVHDASARASLTPDCIIFKDGYAFTLHESPYNGNDDISPAEEKPSIIQNAVENDVKLSKNRYNVDKYDDSSMNYSVMVNGSSASSDSTNGNNGDHSLGVMSGSMASDSKIFNSLCYRNRLCESDKSMPISSDPLDQYNLSATSARTGAPDYCRFPFRAGDHVYPSPILNNLEGCSHSDRGGYFLSANTKLDYSHFPEHVDSSNCPEYHNDDLGSFSVHRRGHLKSKNDKTGTSGDEEIGTMQHACIAYVLREQCGETGENMNVLGQQKSISQPVVSGEAADPQIGPNTAVQGTLKSNPVYFKTMQLEYDFAVYPKCLWFCSRI
ncbi:hypothetical protein B296_00054571 [Ensete ventricosum]|uniref:Uncharacterized protein n=1 Tax=Ensete ventricosum TaxID=4639 RepID=A0A426Y3N1_ENSVE|nr:hypothetical protein B296_00054571 [Ensete ventricosum]